tara:strand:- start:680 stop:901 length:222 start_codon:yes stop_codon:yes gene_type:complete
MMIFIVGLGFCSLLSVGLNLRLLYLIGKGVRIREGIVDFDKGKSLKCQGGCKQLLKDMRLSDENKILLSNKDE